MINLFLGILVKWAVSLKLFSNTLEFITLISTEKPSVITLMCSNWKLKILFQHILLRHIIIFMSNLTDWNLGLKKFTEGREKIWINSVWSNPSRKWIQMAQSDLVKIELDCYCQNKLIPFIVEITKSTYLLINEPFFQSRISNQTATWWKKKDWRG